MPGLSDPTTLEHCLLELVLNSLKAQATAIAVRIHIRDKKIQVIDNGSGIPKNTLRCIGEYSAKRESTENNIIGKKRNIQSKGSLVNIRGLSSCLLIMSRSQLTGETYGKFFRNGNSPKFQRIENRPSCGTTVTVYASSDFCNWSREINSFAVKFIIVYLSLVSFSVRDDIRECILLRIGKFQKQKCLLRVLFEQPVSSRQIKCMKTQFHGNLKISGFWGLNCTDFRRIQQILLNFRPVHCPELENFIIKNVTKICYPCAENSNICLENIFFLVYIDCLDSEYSTSLENTKVTVNFHQIDQILKSIRKCFEKIEAKKGKASTDFDAYESIVPPIACRSMGRILGVKKKRSFFTKVSKHSFQRRNVTLTRFSIEDSNVMNRDIAAPASQNTSPEAFVFTKERKYEDFRVSRSSQEFIEKGRHDKSESLATRPSTSKGKNSSLKSGVSTKERKCNKYTSTMSQKKIKKSHEVEEFPNESQHWLSDYTEVVEISCKSQENCRQMQKDFDKMLQKSESKVANEYLPAAKEYQYENHDVTWISQKCNEKLSNLIEETYDIDCSQWSDWIYEPETRDSIRKKNSKAAPPVLYKRFQFLPLNLHALLPFLNEKLINRDLSVDVEIPMNLKFNHRRQDLDVRRCTQRSLEFKLKVESLKSMTVLNQVNQEFIVALTKQDDKTLVVVVDQHAMHERIRYENLLRAYKRDLKNQQFISMALHRPIIISDLSTSNCSLISSNRSLLARYGLNLALRNESTLLIFAVPRCFLKKSFRADNIEVEIAVRKLLQEVLDNLIANGTKKFLPFTIHDAIASEACHGAIKFGDPLTLKQCESLISCWKETDAPNRCAHGRPSIIPLMELSSHRRKLYDLVCQGKLNFASLRKFRQSTRKMSVTTLRYHPYVTIPRNQ